ncbi:MAG: hypothetical protein ACI8YQ_002497, partial [Polaribacter sp.]
FEMLSQNNSLTLKELGAHSGHTQKLKNHSHPSGWQRFLA